MAKKIASKLGQLIAKKFSGQLKDVYEKVEFIPSGSIILDKVLGGGYPIKRITEIYGPYSSGKTTMALEAIANCQKRFGKAAIFMDYERSFHRGHAESIGVNIDENLYVIEPDYLEHGEEILQEIFRDDEISQEIGIIVFDSVSAMQPKSVVEGEAESKTIGAQARELARFLSKYSKWVSKHNICTIVLNQERTNIKMSMYEAGPSTLSSGGKALQFYNSIKVHLKQVSFEEFNWTNPLTGKSEKKKKTSLIRATCMKNKVAEPFLRGDIVMTFGKGVDDGMAIINIALADGKIEQNKAMYTFTDSTGEEMRIRGKDNVTAWFKERPKEFEALEAWFRNTGLSRDEEAMKQTAALESNIVLEDDFNVRE